MAQKMKAANLLALAKQHGFNGTDTDVEGQKNALINSGKTFKDSKGQQIDIKGLMVEQPSDDQVIVTSVEAAEDESPEIEQRHINPSDIKATVQSAVDAALKNAGVEPKRPSFGAATKELPVTVKSADEIIYEGRIANKQAAFKKVETARLFRDWFLSEVAGNSPQYARHSNVINARKRLEGNPVTKAYATTPNAAGGALVWGEFLPDLINNVNQYGVARRLAKVVPMSSESMTIPVKTGIHTLTYPQQGTAISQSTGVQYSNVQLQAKNGSTIVKVTRQLIQDASINFMDDAFQEIARCIAFTEDYEMLMANGEAAYGNMVGVVPRFTNLGITAAAGRVAGGGDWTAHTNTHLTQLLGLLPQYARQGAVFTCTPEFTQTFIRLAQGQGGVTYQETVDNGYVMKYFGIPVIENNVMNSTSSTGTNTIDLLFGNFQRAAVLGDRMGVELDVSDQRYWDENNIGIRGIIRHDINVHDVGSTSRVGPVVYLYQT